MVALIHFYEGGIVFLHETLHETKCFFFELIRLLWLSDDRPLVILLFVLLLLFLLHVYEIVIFINCYC